MQEFDVIVIGGGPGGYVAAIKAAQLGKKVACIEAREGLGGTCLNVGCIPSKALLNSSHRYFEAAHHFAEHGISFKSLDFSLSDMMKRKNNIVSTLCKGIEGLFKKNKITHFQGFASFESLNTVKIALTNKTNEVIKGSKIIIATGSEPISLPGITIDESQIVSSTGALSLSNVPKKMVVLGGGVIGLEMGSVWSRLGSEVTVVEFMDRILGTGDVEISRSMQKILEKQGLKFILAEKAMSAEKAGKALRLNLESAKDGSKKQLECDVLLIAIGRRAYTQNLGLEKIGIAVDERGRIPVNAHLETSAQGIFAIGDVIKGAMLAHKAEEEGIFVAEIIAGQHPHINYDAIPAVVYTTPEVATVGKTEEELKAQNIEYKVGKFPFMANSRARTSGELDGFVKLLACKKTDTILGAHIIGPGAGELITEICLGMEFKAASEDIARTSHAHPGYSEAVKEAALATFASAIHI